jgi:hypothetical protein
LALCLSLGSTALASTVWYVDGVNGDDLNNCKSAQTACATIGHAISLASSGDSVMVAAATYTENLLIRVSLKITGSGAASTIIDGGYIRVVYIPNTSTVVALANVTIRNGSAAGGGGILNRGTLTLTNSTVSGNTAGSESSSTGAGIYNGGTLTITNTTLSGNSGNSNFMYGGAIYNSGTLTITNSTLSGNSAYGYFGGGGGGIYIASGTVGIANATLFGNTAAGYQGGGIFVAKGATVILQNSIVTRSSTAGNCYGTLASHGYNMSSDGTCNFSNSGDRNNTFPLLGPLQNNGGPTFTQALQSGSPAIDAGNPSGCTDGHGHLLKTDQRGMPRPDKKEVGCDMGAYERQTD